MDWKKIVGAVAPTLATALGGPLAGMAAAAVSDALLGKPNGTDAEIATALQAGGPDALLRLKQADQAFAVRMQELGIDLERVHANDRADARGREVKTGDKATPRVLAGLIVGGFLLMVWFVLAGHVGGLKDPVAAGLIGTLIGYVSAKADQVVSYYFGSSAGSAEKTALLGKR
ncbi:MAG: hypothetical protein ACK5QH_14625 [Rubrivivax sp.]|jgi:hypothetical protein